MILNPHLFRRVRLAVAAPSEITKLQAELHQASRARERANERYRQRLDRAESIQDEIDARQPSSLAQRAELKTAEALSHAKKQFLITGKVSLPVINDRMSKKRKVTKLPNH